MTSPNTVMTNISSNIALEGYLKFEVYELQLENKKYRLYDALDVPTQLRVLYPEGNTPNILANSGGFRFLESIFKIISVSMKANSIIRIKDNSAKREKFYDWYENAAEYHNDLIIFNYQYTQIACKQVQRLLKMLRYKSGIIVDISVPAVSYDDKKWWKLEGTLHVDKRSNFLIVSSNSLGFLYMAEEASDFDNIVDDEDNYDAHSHLFGVCKNEDLLDFRYYFEKTERREL